MPGSSAAVSIETVFRALADRTRLRLVNLMSDGEICVCYFTETLGESQPKVSRHLAYLRRAGLVSARRDGKWIHYRLAEPADANVAEILRSTITWMRADAAMQRDRKHLAKICCAPRLPVALEGAPLPVLNVLQTC